MLWLARDVLFCGVLAERNGRTFRGLERDSWDVWSLLDFVFLFGLDLDHIIWSCELCLGFLLQEFGLMYVRHKNVSNMIEEFLLNPPFGEGPVFMACRRLCDYVGAVG